MYLDGHFYLQIHSIPIPFFQLMVIVTSQTELEGCFFVPPPCHDHSSCFSCFSVPLVRPNNRFQSLFSSLVWSLLPIPPSTAVHIYSLLHNIIYTLEIEDMKRSRRQQNVDDDDAKGIEWKKEGIRNRLRFSAAAAYSGRFLLKQWIVFLY